jgi:hypothetical protein
MVTHIQKSLHQLKSESSRWREIIGMAYDQRGGMTIANFPSAIHT